MMNAARQYENNTVLALPESGLLVDRLLAVMARLQEVMQVEHDMLRRGLPLGATHIEQQKTGMVREYTALWQQLKASGFQMQQLDKDARQKIAAACIALRDITSENMAMIDGVIHASKARIEAVMKAVRGHQQHGYGSAGTRVVAPILPGSTNFKA